LSPNLAVSIHQYILYFKRRLDFDYDFDVVFVGENSNSEVSVKTKRIKKEQPVSQSDDLARWEIIYSQFIYSGTVWKIY